ncbi:hypothetical protein EC988_000050 [Linderina pennispora]|nr:hypothetical protein EC988_000050 [Linderina pennispora]
MSSTTRRKKQTKGNDSPQLTDSKPVLDAAYKVLGPRTTAPAGPSLPTVISIFIGFMSTNILSSSLIRLGPQYLEPVFGNVLPYLNYFYGILFSFILGGLMGSSYWRYILSAMSPVKKRKGDRLTIDTKTTRAIAMAFDMAAILTALAPTRASYLFRYSDMVSPMWGPMIVYCLFTFPAFVLGGFIAVLSAARVSYNPQSKILQGAISIAYLSAVAMSVWLGHIFARPQVACTGILFNAIFAGLSSVIIKLLTGYQETVDSVDALEALKAASPDGKLEKDTEELTANLRDRQIRKLQFLPAGGVLFFALTTFFSQPSCTNGLTAANNRNTTQYHMLSRHESITGWVSVSDETQRGIRLLRSGHSILGGQWNTTNESIFGVFYYPDAVRLIKDNKHHPASKSKGMMVTKKSLIGDGSERALQIGLGIGVSARSLHEQNVRVDVVEIDPEVYKAAVSYFMLPTNLNGVYLQDGRTFIDKSPDHTYDYIVHDVFTGGSVPSSLFSESAIAQLERILKPNGTLAMNYVGVMSDTRSLYHVARTISTVFSHVRCFAESLDDMDGLTNMMFFASNGPLEFDISHKVLRAMDQYTIRSIMLSKMEEQEINIDAAYADDVKPITDQWNPLPQWQVGSAIAHWKAMRDLFPTEYWLNY